MIPLNQRISAFIHLGDWLKDFCKTTTSFTEDTFKPLALAVSKAHTINPWVIEPFFNQMIQIWADKLSKESLQALQAKYPELEKNHPTRNIAVIPQENIPLAGFHDLLCTLLAGHHFYCRNNNHECDVLQIITNKISEFEPSFAECISWCVQFPKDIDTYLVYAKSAIDGAFNQYFGGKQNLIRERRVSVGVLVNTDKIEDYQKYAADIFPFFGHSNRNIRKLYVPDGFTVDSFYPALEEYAFVYQYNRYANNFDYQRSVLLMDRIAFFENGFLIMRENPELHAPIGCLHFEYYHGYDDLNRKLKKDENEIQQIVTNASFIPNAIKPGNAHLYPLFEFDDQIDVIDFLIKIGA